MVLVLGSINMDLIFALPRLPAEGETVLTPSFSEAMGGKGANQALAAARDGAATRFIGSIGADDFGTRARATLAADGVDVSGLATASAATGIASIFVDAQGRNKIAVASGANGRVLPSALPASLLSPRETLVLQMEIPVATIEAAIERASRAGARIILNLAPAMPISERALRAVSILVVNEHEAATLCGHLSIAASSHEDRTHALARRLGTTVIATLGAEGALAVADDATHRVPALAVDAVDTTGAGDCFVGVLAAALERGLALPHAMARAAVAASLACTVMGAAPSFPRREQIDRAHVP